MFKIKKTGKIARIYNIAVVKSLVNAVFFGIASYILGFVRFDVSDMVGVMSDFREIPLLISVLYIKNPVYYLIICGISTLGISDLSSFPIIFSMHLVSNASIWFIYSFIRKKTNNCVRPFIWFFISIFYYFLLLSPRLFANNVMNIFHILTFSSYLDVVYSIRFEIIASSLVSTFYLLQFQSMKLLRKHKASLEKTVLERTNKLVATNEKLLASNEELSVQKEQIANTLNKLKRAQQKLIQAEKMSSLGVLAAGVAHEINNPLNYIQGGILGIENYIKENKLGKNEKIEFSIYAMKTGIERAAKIVQSLNHYSRKNRSHTEKCDLHAIIDNCLLMLHNKLKHKVEVRKYYSPERLILIGNEGKLHQAIINILTNAEQAIKGNGAISIKTRKTVGFIELSVSDTGSGIKEDIISKITDPFFTTKPPGEGTGLGLSISENIIKEHNGTIKFESTKNKETKVTVKLKIES